MTEQEEAKLRADLKDNFFTSFTDEQVDEIIQEIKNGGGCIRLNGSTCDLFKEEVV